MSARAIYVTGTDTGVGKTHASVAMLHALRARGVDAVGMKPVASGCRASPDGLRNDDAQSLLDAGMRPRPYADCNPYAYAEAIAPHVAARLAGVEPDIRTVRAAYARLANGSTHVVVEGAGGWMAPFSASLMQSEVARALGCPVVLVVGVRLGCINHALLSTRAIAADGCRLAGWIANRIDPAMPFADDTVATLLDRIDAPMLGDLAYGAHAHDAAAGIDVEAAYAGAR